MITGFSNVNSSASFTVTVTSCSVTLLNLSKAFTLNLTVVASFGTLVKLFANLTLFVALSNSNQLGKFSTSYGWLSLNADPASVALISIGLNVSYFLTLVSPNPSNTGPVLSPTTFTFITFVDWSSYVKVTSTYLLPSVSSLIFSPSFILGVAPPVWALVSVALIKSAFSFVKTVSLASEPEIVAFKGGKSSVLLNCFVTSGV